MSDVVSREALSDDMRRPVVAPGALTLKSRKEEAYAQQRALGYCQRESARRAGLDDYSGIFAKYERKPRVQRRISFLRSQDMTNEYFIAKRRQIEQRLELAAFGSVFEFTKVVNGAALIDWDELANGELGVTVSDLKIDKDTGKIIGLSRDNALAAVQQLRDMRGLKAPDHVKLSVGVETLSDEDLLRVVNNQAPAILPPPDDDVIEND